MHCVYLSISIYRRNRNADEAAAIVGRVAPGGPDSGRVRPTGINYYRSTIRIMNYHKIFSILSESCKKKLN